MFLFLSSFFHEMQLGIFFPFRTKHRKKRIIYEIVLGGMKANESKKLDVIHLNLKLRAQNVSKKVDLIKLPIFSLSA